ncbi:MAG TPA: AI-2E family transporter [Chloroflexota bacterium]|nr:AI-2E family transporter [Chloroflexota bacterium]
MNERIPIRFDLLNVALATAVVLLVIATFQFVAIVKGVLVLVIFAIIVATAIEPLVMRLRRLGLRRGQGVLLIYLGLAIALIIFFVLVVQTVVEQAGALIAALPELLTDLREMAFVLPPGLIQDTAFILFDSIAGTELPAFLATGTLSGLVFATLSLFEGIFVVLTVFVIAFFWISERLTIRRLLIRAIRPEHRERTLTIWEDVEEKLGSWVRGQLFLMTIIGVMMGAGYTLMGVQFALLLGIIAGLTEAIPIVGPYLGAIPAVLVALTQDFQLALMVAGYTAVVQIIESNVLIPRIMKNAVGLTPLSVIVALLIGATLYGIVGALLAVPIAAVVQVALIDLIEPRPESAPADESEPSSRAA